MSDCFAEGHQVIIRTSGPDLFLIMDRTYMKEGEQAK